ncbi:MAG: molybdopterin-guanine dinucleotide biosynthesis protein B [Methanoregula sp.]|jgi:molybdopterin-guanine dinucleotide biosynthesis protein MobB|uniref:molybdopterin-guanine dinucleotide biosynthesis protein B n=1 Tax=Methanoregula sp. TaxID=2052170 RepID=UPI003C295BCB
MKIIQVSGWANTGKTTFIRNLIPVLKSHGRVGVIKHLIDHDYRLDEGKDTTVFFENGADISAGIDTNKSVIALHTVNLDEILQFFKKDGVDFAVIEGFKKRNFPKIIIGDLPSDTCVLRNPTADQVISSLSLFEDY